MIGGGLTTAGAAVGTVLYMSPEQARGQLVDARTDLFSLGTVMYQMASGKMPFQGDTSAMIFDAILNRDPAPVAEENPAMRQRSRANLSKLLEKDRRAAMPVRDGIENGSDAAEARSGIRKQTRAWQ